ncbi:MAG TPA: helix-turn-helix domain-containing protein [Hanamia sp.]|nr:helix-turn-helix domain-containing protein [Hanamia sp.]
MDLQNKKVLNFTEACEFLGLKKSYMYKLTSNGILPFSKPNGGKIFFDREKLETWALSNSSKSYSERQVDAATNVSINPVKLSIPFKRRTK